MKILFVTRVVEYIDPMNIELMSALARRVGHATYLSILAQDDLEADVRRIKPDIVAFSTLTGEVSHYLKAAAVVKQVSQNIITVMGGPHCTFFPEVIEEKNIDYVGSGECDDAWPNLLTALNTKKDVDSILNIFTKDNWAGKWKAAGENRRNHLAGRTTNLDGLPFFDRELVYNHTPLGEFPMLSFMASRGCPFECTYCFEPKFNKIYSKKGPIFNRYSVERLCEEIKEAVTRWPKQFVKFYDDMFFVNKDVKKDLWLQEFAEVYPREVGLPFFCLTRCNVLTEEHLQLLKPAGLHSLTMSIEAGNEYIRSHVIKRHMTEEEIRHAFYLCKKYNIVTFANSIFGIPVKPEIMAEQGKTAIDYDIESLDINIDCKVTFAEFGTAYPYPGCELSEYVVENGWFDQNDFDKLHISYAAESPLNCFSPKEKMMQNNLALLSTVCVAFPSLRNLTVKILIKLPLAKLYFLLYYLTKGYLNVFKVYPMKFTFWNLLRNMARSFRLEWKKRAPGQRLYKKPNISSSPTNQMLGGSSKI
ncbi:B12-binding domain-containing radical SAM protein [Candidatus Parcubacteria bacterium]|nr:B12-binding domain-containing radical SAM protein [Candidatus Parcubacteria bacterium]